MKDSQKNMLEHSQVKIKLLKTYLERYFNILNGSKYCNKVLVYDLFCSCGIYENGEKGSPIIILEAIKDLLNDKTTEFICEFNDIDKDKIDILKQYIEENDLNLENCKINYHNQDYTEIVENVTQEVEDLFNDEKAFIFIDPYGYKEINIEQIQRLLDAKNSEVLLFLPTNFMFRFERSATPESLKRFIDQIVPEKLWPKSKTGLDFIYNLKDAFREKLSKDYFVDSFVIGRELNQYFCLYFFTSHILGFEKMIEAKWNIDEEEGRGWFFNENPSLFEDNKDQRIIEEYEIKLQEFLKKFRSNLELYEFTLHNGHLPKHTNQILKKWQKNDKLYVEDINGETPRKSAFYVNWENYKSNIPKIIIKVK